MSVKWEDLSDEIKKDIEKSNNYLEENLNNNILKEKLYKLKEQLKEQLNKEDIKMEKTLDVVSSEDLKKKVSDVQIIGNPDTFQLICKASSKEQGWMKSTKAMDVDGLGVVLQVSTQQGSNVAEAITFIPNAKILVDVNGNKHIAHPNYLCGQE